MFIKASGRMRPPIVRFGRKHVCCDEWIDVLRVRLNRKTRQVGDRMSEVVSKIAGLCLNKGRMDKEKVRAIMERVAEPATLWQRNLVRKDTR